MDTDKKQVRKLEFFFAGLFLTVIIVIISVFVYNRTDRGIISKHRAKFHPIINKLLDKTITGKTTLETVRAEFPANSMLSAGGFFLINYEGQKTGMEEGCIPQPYFRISLFARNGQLVRATAYLNSESMHKTEYDFFNNLTQEEWLKCIDSLKGIKLQKSE